MKKNFDMSIIIPFVMVFFALGCSEDMLMVIENSSESTSVADSLSEDTLQETKMSIQYVFPNDVGFLKTYIQAHPRLILTSNLIQSLKEQSKTDALLNKYVTQVLGIAQSKLGEALPVYTNKVNVAGSFNTLAWDVLDDVTTLSFAYLWTGESKYAAKSKQILLTVSAFPDWISNRMLDVSIMASAVSLGFDWLYNYLDSSSRLKIKNALINKCLSIAKPLISSKQVYWTQSNNNWNIICNSGLITASLAVAEWNREYADAIILPAVNNLAIALKEFSPHGSWFEGPLYGKISLDIFSICVSSMLSSTNNTLNLTSYEGLDGAGDFYASMEGPSGYLLCYSDIAEKSKRRIMGSLFFLGSLYKKYGLINNEKNFLTKASVFHVIWYKQTNTSIPAKENRYFRGSSPTIIFNDDTYGSKSIYLGAKVGQNGSSHGHLDLGNFEFDALGVRWARDLGFDNYNINGYFDSAPTGKRWSIYRVSSLSHNVPIINNSNQNVTASASFSKYSLNSTNPYCVMDLSQAYSVYANKIIRGIKLIDKNRSLIIQDEFSLKSSQECYSGITTDATITLIDGQNAKLTLNGQVLYAKILSDKCTFSIQSAAQTSPQNSNTGVKRLIAKHAKSSTLNFSIVVMYSPNFDGYRTSTTVITSLSQW